MYRSILALGGLAIAACSVRPLPSGGEGSSGEVAASSPTDATSAAPTDGHTDDRGDATSDAPGTSSSSEGEDVDDGAGFIRDPDASMHPSCDVERQTGCARGEKCMLEDEFGSGSWTTGRCHPLDPDGVGIDEPCAYQDGPYQGPENCDGGSLCMWPDAEGIGRCVGLCMFVRPDSYEATCEDPNAAPQVGCHTCFCLCIPGCDPLGQDCGEGEGCYAVSDSFQCVPDASGDDGALGDACEFVNVCDPGLFCAAAEVIPGCEGATGCCGAFCDLRAPACSEGTECVAWYEEGQSPPGLEHIGACVLPT